MGFMEEGVLLEKIVLVYFSFLCEELSLEELMFCTVLVLGIWLKLGSDIRSYAGSNLFIKS
jgi:hypothetical protein